MKLCASNKRHLSLLKSQTSATFRQLLWRSGFTDFSMRGLENIARYLHVTPRTIRRWLHSDKPSKQAISLLEIKQTTIRKSDLWDNFVFRDNYLITPEGFRLDVQALRCYSVYMQLIHAVVENVDYSNIPQAVKAEKLMLEMVANGQFDRTDDV